MTGFEAASTTSDNTTDSSLSSTPSSANPFNAQETLRFKSNNPFASANGDAQRRPATIAGLPTAGTLNNDEPISESATFSQNRTSIATADLKNYPFKTLNRILDDLKWTVPYRSKHNSSLLNSKPIDYASNLSNIVTSKLHDYHLLTLNNLLEYSPSVEEQVLDDTSQSLLTIRGLVVNANEVYHFRLLVLEAIKNPFQSPIDIHEYHIIPRSILSNDDSSVLRTDETINLIDDAYFMSANSPNTHVLRVSLFLLEFSKDHLFSLSDPETIKKRYHDGLEKHPSLSADTIPTAVQTFKTLVKVLKGPILLKADDPMKTISLKSTVLDAQIDIGFLLRELSFRTDAEQTELVPPSLNHLPGLREQYIRKVQELIYLGKILGSQVSKNDFDTTYSYSDNLSLVFTKIPEYDKHLNLVHFKTHNSNQLPFLISLSVCAYFQDELIIKCFENTVASDMQNKLHYVDALKNTISFRNGSTPKNKLTKYVKNLSAQGDLIGFYDYLDSMKVLGLSVREPNEINNIDDDVVIAMYKTSFKSDPKNYSYFNGHLQKIAKVRESKKLLEYLDNEIIPINLAIEELSIEEITEDDVVVTAYEFKLDEILQANGFNANGSEVKFLNRSLLSVGVNRKSHLLLNYIETKLPNIVNILKEGITYHKALEILDCDSQSSEFEIITNFQNKLSLNDTNDIESDIRTLRYSVRVIAENRTSEILLSFLTSGKIVPSLLPAVDWPAGLDNIGNTCYLNSLLQYYFCIKPLREMVLDFSENKDLNLIEGRKIGGRKVEALEIERSNQFIYHLRHLFSEMIHTDKRCVQPLKELAYLSFLPSSQPVQFKTADPDVIEILDDNESENEPILVSSVSPSSETEVEDVVMLESDIKVEEDEVMEVKEDNLSRILDTENLDSAGPKILPISLDQMDSTIEVGRQQDVTECIENVTYQIETALAPERLDTDGEQYDLIKKLFYGKTKQTITPLESTDSTPRISIERFFSLIINVSDHPKNIYDSLDTYFSEDLVKLEDGVVKKSITISELPEVLQFHVQRVMFDREKLVAYKSNEHIPFSERIYLDRYLDTEDPEILSRRNEVFSWKSEIKELNDKKKQILEIDEQTNLNIIDTLVTTKKYLESRVLSHETLSVNPATIVTIQEQIDALKSELNGIDGKLHSLHEKVSNQFTSYTKVGYSIFAIFIHRGEASYGHYWIYIKDPHRNVYRKYNDETVTEVSTQEVFNFSEGNTATPYYIVYVKENLENDYVEPLKRDID